MIFFNILHKFKNSFPPNSFLTLPCHVLENVIESFDLNIRFLTLSMSINVVDKFKELFPLNSFLTLPMSINVVDKFKELFPLNIFLTLSMSWTSSKSSSLLTYTINVLDKLTELFPPNPHFQFLGQVHRIFPLNNFLDKFKELFSFNNFLTLSISWTYP